MLIKDYKEATFVHAREFAEEEIYKFSDLEEKALSSFFTNTRRRVFFMHTLPTNMGNTLLAMYSRMKNPRGLRGVFADSFLPELLAGFLNPDSHGGDGLKWLKDKKIKSLEEFVSASPEARYRLKDFLREIRVNPEYLEQIANSKKTRDFNDRVLDKFGHNSVARPGMFWICFEQISILAAKSLEWGRPGAGYIELSTRYVDMGGKDVYPAAREIVEYGVKASDVEEVIQKSFDLYRQLQGKNFDGPFPAFLREKYGHLFGDAKDLENGVIGETCDVLGNFLPASTLTSVGVGVSGEAFQEMLKHLFLDATPENIALIEMALAEARKIGADQFARHIEPTGWKEASWEYLSVKSFDHWRSHGSKITGTSLIDRKAANKILLEAFRKKESFGECRSISDVMKKMTAPERGSHDKLPNEFERINASFSGIMSFRSWRDLQRQSFCAHFRTYVTPLLGFYFYDKRGGAPTEFYEACKSLHASNLRLYSEMKRKGVPDGLAQYPLAIGNMVGFDISANLLQWEFCNWQRSKFSVNYEARKIFLDEEKILRKHYPWWAKISRADTTPDYVFARTKHGIPLK